MEEIKGMNRYGDVPGWRIPNISSHLPMPFVVSVLEILGSEKEEDPRKHTAIALLSPI